MKLIGGWVVNCINAYTCAAVRVHIKIPYRVDKYSHRFTVPLHIYLSKS